jgi:hypothetical protein
MISIVFVSLLVILSGFAYLICTINDRIQDPPDIESLRSEMANLTIDMMTTDHLRDADSLECSIEEAIPTSINSSFQGIDGYSVRIDEIEANISSYLLPIAYPTFEPIIPMANGSRINSRMYGSQGYVPMIPIFRVDVNASVTFVPEDHGSVIHAVLNISREVVDETLFLEHLMDLIPGRSHGNQGWMAWDVEYMLNTLTRIRTLNQVGLGNRQGPYNILNGGDVELVLNMGLALRMAAITGRTPRTLTDSIDMLYRDHTLIDPMDRTSYRQWGKSENDNYHGYELRSDPIGSRRSFTEMIDRSIDVGYADPADLMLRYLYLDRTNLSLEKGLTFDPYDRIGPLEEAYLLNPRNDRDMTDPTSLQHVVCFPSKDGLIPERTFTVDGENYSKVFRPKLDLDNG